MFPKTPKIYVKGGIEKHEVEEFVKNKKEYIVITTYSSSYKTVDIEYDIKILDEVHHLTTKDISKKTNKYVSISKR